MKRILAMALSVLLIAGMAIGGSVAYLTSTDDATNTFVMGDVEIDQIEQERGEDGMKDFTDGQRLLPAHLFQKDDYEVSYTTFGREWAKSSGAIDKFVHVENKGDEDAYVRTIFAFEDTGNIDSDGYIIKNINPNGGTFEPVMKDDGTIASFAYNGEVYNLYVFTYTEALSATEIDPANYSLKQVAMAAQVGNEVVDAIAQSTDGKYTILVASQAVQKTNMVDANGKPIGAKAALEAAFGEISSTNNPWVNDEAGNTEAGNVVRISSKADLLNLGNINSDTTIVIEKDIDLDGAQMNTIMINARVKIVGNNHVISKGKIEENMCLDFNAAAMFNLQVGTAREPVSLTVENLSFKNFTVNADAVDDTDDDHDYAAILVGYAYEGDGITLNNVNVYDSTITSAGHDAAAFIGHSRAAVTLNNCGVYNTTIEGAVELDADKDSDAVYNTGIKYAEGTHRMSAAFVGTVNGWDQRSDGSLTLTIKNCKNGTDLPDWYRHFNTKQSGTASKTYTISTAAELKSFANSVNTSPFNKYDGKTIVLLNDIDLDGTTWEPIGQTGNDNNSVLEHEFKGTFDGNGHTIKNFKVDTSSSTGNQYMSAGLFGFSSDCVIKNLTVENATIKGNHYSGAIIGYNSGKVLNCTVKNSSVTSVHFNGDLCGDKAGAITGMLGADVAKIENCKAYKVTVSGCRDVGKIVGAVTALNSVTGCTAEDVTISAHDNTSNACCSGDNHGGYIGAADTNKLVGHEV